MGASMPRPCPRPFAWKLPGGYKKHPVDPCLLSPSLCSKFPNRNPGTLVAVDCTVLERRAQPFAASTLPHVLIIGV